MLKRSLGAFAVVIALAAAAGNPGEFDFKGGDFEEEFKGIWRFVDADGDGKCTLSSVQDDCVSGKSSAKVVISKAMRSYSALSRGARISGEPPHQFSLSVKSSASSEAFIRWDVRKDGKTKLVYHSFRLPVSPEWKKCDFLLNPPEGASGFTLEIRCRQAGTYQYDNIQFFITPEQSLLEAANVYPFTDGGFEKPLSAKSWGFASIGEPQKAVFTQENSDSAEGKCYAKVVVKEAMKHYFTLNRSGAVKGTAPEQFSIAYCGTQRADVVIRWTYKKDGKNATRYDQFSLPASEKWKNHTFMLKAPAGTIGFNVELRGRKAGTYQFDELKFFFKANRTPAALLLSPSMKQGNPIINAYGNLPGPEVKVVLEKYGFSIASAKYSEQFDRDFLSQFSVVVLGLSDESSNPMPPEARKKMNAQLLDFVRDGGGLIIFRAPHWDFDRGIGLRNQFLQPLGAEILCEQVTDEKNSFLTPGLARIFWTDNFAKHPITDGVGGIFYSDVYGNYGAYTDFTNAIKVNDPAWRIVVSGMADASTYARPKGHPIRPKGQGTYQSAPPLLAAREYGKGRIVLFPAASSIYWQDGSHMFWGRGAVMNGEYQGKRGDNLKLVENIFRYVSAPAKEHFGGWKPTAVAAVKEEGFRTIDWNKVAYRGNYAAHRYQGLVGAQSNLSCGKGDPQEYIDAAKKAGYDFIAFLEPLDKMSEEKFNKLRAICKAASDDKFNAYPGLTYLDNSGNQWGAFSDTMFWPKKAWFSTEHPERISTLNASTRGWGWPPVIMVAPGKNPEKPYLQGNFKSIAALTYRNGQLVEDSRKIYQRLIEDCHMISPLVVHFVDDPAQVVAAKNTGFQSRIWWPDNHVSTGYSGNYCRYHEKYFWTRPVFVSEGPDICDFRIFNFGTADLAVPGNDRWRMHVRASSDAGLKEVKVFAANGQLLCRFLPQGEKLFDQQFDGWHTANHSYFLEVTDVNGKQALSNYCGTGVQENTFQFCSDNINSMPRGKWFGQPEYMQNIRGFENYFANRDWTYRLPRVDYIGKEGVHIAVNYHPVFNSRYGTILDCRVNQHYPDSAKYHPDANDNKSCAVPNEYFTAIFRQTLFCGRNNGPLVTRIDGEIEILKDFSSAWLSVMNEGRLVNGAGESKKFSYTAENGETVTVDLAQQKSFLRKKLPVNGFAALYPDLLNGSVGFIALTPNFEFELRPHGSDKRYRLYAKIAHGSEYKKGEKITVSFITVISQLDPPQDDSFIRNVIEKFGINGNAPATVVTAETGKIAENGLVLKLVADQYGFSGKTTKTVLPYDLPVAISGLNPNWDAGLLYKGKTALQIQEYRSNAYHQSFVVQVPRTVTDELQHIPVQPDGTGLCQIDTMLDAHDLFIGNLLCCDVPELKLTVTECKNGKAAFAAHNPTDHVITATVQPVKGFELMGSFAKTITVQPGSTQLVQIK